MVLYGHWTVLRHQHVLLNFLWLSLYLWPVHLWLFKAVTTPSMAVSHIMLEAYKKHVLVSLIVHGKVCITVASSLTDKINSNT